MKLARCYQIEKAVSDDETRVAICHAYLDTKAKKLIATDGHCMAVVPVTELDSSPGASPNDSDGLVSAKAIVHARKATPKSIGDTVLSANGVHAFVDGSTMPRPKDAQFPPWEQVLPSYRVNDPGTITVGFDAKLLVDLAKAIGMDNTKNCNNAAVYLTFPVSELIPADKRTARVRSALRTLAKADMLDPFVIGGKDGAIGVLMPCRR